MRKQQMIRKLAAALTVAMVCVALSLALAGFVGGKAVTYAQADTKAQLQGLSAAFRDVAKKVSPAVVYISVEQTVKGQQQVPDQFRDFFGDDFMRRFFGNPDQPRKQRGLGSGFIISKDGYILTNNHVVEKADKVKVTLADKRELNAKVVGTDPKTDVAVIKIDGENFPTAPLGDSTKIAVGDWVIAIGTPFGLAQTVTAGIISAEGRTNIGIMDGGYEDFIQTDAAINPGNSGGPLVNIEGEVIGINTAIFSQSGGYQGIGFAIPIDMAKNIKDSLITKGKVVRGWLGVRIQDLTADMAKRFELKDTTGSLVSEVLKGGPAEKAGLEVGDVIIAFDGKAVDNTNTLRNLVAQTAVDKKAPVLVIRNGQEKTIDVTIGEQEAGMQANAGKSPEVAAKSGLSVQELTPDIAEQLGYGNDRGVVISDVAQGSAAADAGLRRGDLIKEVNRTPVRSLKDYDKAMAAVAEKEGFLLLIRRGDSTMYILVNVE